MDIKTIEPDRKKWDHSNDEPIICTCRTCGSSGVTRDATVRWDVETQTWQLSGIFDNSDCDVCGETGLVDTPVENYAGDIPNREELPVRNRFVSAKQLADGSYLGVAETDDDVTHMISEHPHGGQLTSAEEAKDIARLWLFEKGQF